MRNRSCIIASFTLLLGASLTVAANPPSQSDPRSETPETTMLNTEPPVIIHEAEGTPFAASAGSSGFSDSASAQRARQRFLRLDENGDGELSDAEIRADSALAEQFAGYDINGDGVIARNEYQSYFAAQNWLEGERQRLAGNAEDGGD